MGFFSPIFTAKEAHHEYKAHFTSESQPAGQAPLMRIPTLKHSQHSHSGRPAHIKTEALAHFVWTIQNAWRRMERTVSRPPVHAKWWLQPKIFGYHVVPFARIKQSNMWAKARKAIPLLRLFMCLGGGPVTARSREQLFKEYAAGPRGVTAIINPQITSREAFAKECRKSLEWFSLP